MNKPSAVVRVTRRRLLVEILNAKSSIRSAPERWQTAYASWGSLMHAELAPLSDGRASEK